MVLWSPKSLSELFQISHPVTKAGEVHMFANLIGKSFSADQDCSADWFDGVNEFIESRDELFLVFDKRNRQPE